MEPSIPTWSGVRLFVPALTQEPVQEGLRLLSMALMLAVLYHGALLPYTHGNTYDAFIHMFFADSYNRSWFDVWEPRWYTGFATTSYPPGTHMAQAALMNIMPLRAAFIVVQLGGLVLLTVGVYRFSRLWVGDRASGYAALMLVLASSVSETVHLFGQLPTICSLGLFLNGLPWVFRWIARGGYGNLFAATALAAATTAAHHVTTIFGGVLFVFPLALHAWVIYLRSCKTTGRPWWRRLSIWLQPVGRGLVLGVLMVGAMVLTVFPYWAWSVSDPITQVSIPHGSRESFIERPDLGFVFFVLPWGLALLFLPYVLFKTLTTRLWPLGGAVFFCFVLGTGGTTPVPRAILGGAFDILTLDRFTFWATILILPFLGLMLDSLLHGRSRRILREALGALLHRGIVASLFLGFVAMSMLAAILPSFRPTQPDFIDPAPIVQFLDSDQHYRWRYLTLGFGDQFAYLSAQTTALSVDGNYHSARRLPDLTRYSVERLENAKYLGVPGLGSLRQFLVNAERYNLKYVFANDAFYDPLLWFSGWSPLNRLQNGVVVWERPDMPPLPRHQPRRSFSVAQQMMWGILPPVALTVGLVILLAAAVASVRSARPADVPPMAMADSYPDPARVRVLVVGLLALAVCAVAAISARTVIEMRKPLSPESVIARYFGHLDFRRFEDAHGMLDPVTRANLEDSLFAWRWRGGLIASYGKLDGLRIITLDVQGDLADAVVELDWLTALELVPERREVRLVQREGQWFVIPEDLRPWQTPERLLRAPQVAWTTMGRRQPLPDSDLHRDQLDRPRIVVNGANLVRLDGLLSVVGQVTNADADPAHVTLHADALANGVSQSRQAAGTIAAHRLRPAESAGFRVTFENVLSLEDAEAQGGFDPTSFIPPEFDTRPDGAAIDVRTVVRTDGHYRGIALTGLDFEKTAQGLVLEGLASNTGIETSTISSVQVLLYDMDGRPVWAETGFLRGNLYPGQSEPFQVAVPECDQIEIVAAIPPETIIANGGSQYADLDPPGAATATWPLSGLGGCLSARLHVSTMTYAPLD
ncbi:hypothetical protein [Marivita sp.]|uniref:hypothetical protein n=1 Tax=Marivita sp. TaxID=2003365 RepID=UPI0025C4610B|nr:hypothetical protein [Marivita sp.]